MGMMQPDARLGCHVGIADAMTTSAEDAWWDAHRGEK